MKRLITLVLFSAALFALGQTIVPVGQNIDVSKISQLPVFTGQVPTNALFVLAIPGVKTYSMYAAPLANGLQTLQSNYTFLTNLQFTPGVAVNGFYPMTPVTTSTATNVYMEDFGRTNSFGQLLIYAMVSATNDFVIGGPTNIRTTGQNLSYGVVSSPTTGSFIRVWLPTNNLVHFSTNYGPWNFYPSNTYYVAYLTNGSLFRMSMQNNFFIERRWLVQ